MKNPRLTRKKFYVQFKVGTTEGIREVKAVNSEIAIQIVRFWARDEFAPKYAESYKVLSADEAKGQLSL